MQQSQIFTSTFTYTIVMWKLSFRLYRFRNFATKYSIKSPARFFFLFLTPSRILIELFVNIKKNALEFLFTLIAFFTCVKLKLREFSFLLCNSWALAFCLTGTESFANDIFDGFWEGNKSLWGGKFERFLKETKENLVQNVIVCLKLLDFECFELLTEIKQSKSKIKYKFHKFPAQILSDHRKSRK